MLNPLHPNESFECASTAYIERPDEGVIYSYTLKSRGCFIFPGTSSQRGHIKLRPLWVGLKAALQFILESWRLDAGVSPDGEIAHTLLR